MLFKKDRMDERNRRSMSYWAAIWLGVTQVLLAGVIFYRLYVLNQPDAEIRDFQFVLGVSIFGFMAIQLFIGGLLPVPTWKGAVLLYLGLFILVAAVGIGVHGWPKPEDWRVTWLPGVIGPAIFIGLYWFVAWAGKRHSEHAMIQD